jgi:hypothetical protein
MNLIFFKFSINTSMGLASGFRRMTATVSPVYCNPFSHRCNCFFQKKQCFFKNFSDRGGQKPKNSPNRVPEQPEGGAKELSKSHFPSCGACRQSQRAAQPDISTADKKAEPQPCPSGGKDKNGIGKIGHFPPQGSQKSVQHPQQHPIKTGGEEPDGGNGRYRHPNSRFAQPAVCRGSS